VRLFFCLSSIHSNHDVWIELSFSRKEKIPSGVYVRSTRFVPVKASMQLKLQTAMADHGLGIMTCIAIDKTDTHMIV
jgi:hypothetical protein